MPRNIAQNVDNAIPILATSVDPHFARLEAKLKRELGETVLQLLAARDTEDIVLNPDSSLWAKRMSKDFERVGAMAPAQAASVLNTIAAWKGTVMNHDRPVLETELPLDGSRFEGIVSPVVRNPVFAIRLRPKHIFTLADYESADILTGRGDARNRTGAVPRGSRRHCPSPSSRARRSASAVTGRARSARNRRAAGSKESPCA